MFPGPRHRAAAWALALALAAAAAPAARAATGQATEFADLRLACAEQDPAACECQNRLEAVFANYTAPVSQFLDCDTACLRACEATLRVAVVAETAASCPRQTDIQRCLRVFSEEWLAYVSQCELFRWSVAYANGGEDLEGGAAAEGEAASGRRLLAAASEGEGEGEGGGAGAGCFPAMTSAEDFARYVNGEFWASYQPGDAAWGTVLSVLFWTGLAALGFLMGRPSPPPSPAA
jgi:hypothetical protein